MNGTRSELDAARCQLEKQLLAEADINDLWQGRLSSSALATAVAVVALRSAETDHVEDRVWSGLSWLQRNANPDGGWGDSPNSRSNLSTTLLVWAALSSFPCPEWIDLQVLVRAECWLRSRIGSLDARAVARAVLEFYGNDRTFSAPILTMLSLCGCLGRSWRRVPQLPLELGVFPQRLFRWLRLPVVSYAIPALIAIGLVRHRHAPSRLMPVRWLRNLLIPKLLHKLETLQPVNGGFLEATPLTAFVTMSLAASNCPDHPVTQNGVRFLCNAQRADGSWPIDSNLTTWVTTLAVKALAADGELESSISNQAAARIRDWLLDQQLEEAHVFTGAAPGGWSWTDLPGGVPDADDTSGALLALHELHDGSESIRRAVARGMRWLLDLQNPDGGIPTFCRGWGRLPFDRSCPDITAHALRAWVAWREEISDELRQSVDEALFRGCGYLAEAQQNDGSWLPLWFGNQWREGESNPVYGTAVVVEALNHRWLLARPGMADLVSQAHHFLVSAQNHDGGWGRDSRSASTFEETALALTALAGSHHHESLDRGVSWWLRHKPEDMLPPPSPIGLYFASLWYSEQLYPVVFGVKALRRLVVAGVAKEKAA
jgi:squalene-hopene/tetraprenyl-beta-curcumene cyclase